MSTTTTSSSAGVGGSSSNKDNNENDIHRILTFWFDPAHPFTRWFTPSPTFDAEITSLFSPLVTAARSTSTLDTWSLSSPQSALALLLLLDQFPRNIHRNTPLAFATDAKALRVAATAIAQGFDRRVGIMESIFYYLPFEHAEDVVAQTGSVALAEGLAARAEREGAVEQDAGMRELVARFVESAKSHRDVVGRFGRFPARNRALGRESTEEERKFLEEHPHGLY
ncbi:MAG: hypothetical protein Q9167_005918 [Letrouitia subvulpina]